MNRLRLLVLLALGSLLHPVFADSKERTQAILPWAERARAASLVRWQPWNEDTLARARQQTRPVYLFVGSELNELTRATLRETFNQQATADWLNAGAFCIFADADTHPAVAASAHHFLTSARQLRGQPMHLWLTPDLRVYEGFNYLPPSEEWGKPGFLKSTRTALETWTQTPERARALAEEAAGLMRMPPLKPSDPEGRSTLDRAAAAWMAEVDAENGGFGTAPKLPEPELIRFLLRRDAAGQGAALQALRALVRGAVHDAPRGGFYRRAMDAEWKEPYRQKRLIDQARLVLALLEGFTISQEASLRDAAFSTLDFVHRDLLLPDGTFAAAIDGTDVDTHTPAAPAPAVRVGRASLAAHGLLLGALAEAARLNVSRFGTASLALERRIRSEIRASDHQLPHQAGSEVEATVLDYLAVADGLRRTAAPGTEATAQRLFERAMDRYLSADYAIFLAWPRGSPRIFVEGIPWTSDTLDAAALAFPGPLPPSVASALRGTLLSQIEHDPLPPGDLLFALAASMR